MYSWDVYHKRDSSCMVEDFLEGAFVGSFQMQLCEFVF